MDGRALGGLADKAGMIAPGQVYASHRGTLVVVVIREDLSLLVDGWRCLVLHDYDDVTPVKAGRLLCYRKSFLTFSCERIS